MRPEVPCAFLEVRVIDWGLQPDGPGKRRSLYVDETHKSQSSPAGAFAPRGAALKGEGEVEGGGSMWSMLSSPSASPLPW